MTGVPAERAAEHDQGGLAELEADLKGLGVLVDDGKQPEPFGLDQL